MKAVYAAGTDYDNPLSQLKVGELDAPEPKPFWSMQWTEPAGESISANCW